MDQDWWRGAVIYQIYPRSFQDGDGDGIGDLKGITSRLEHVASLGVDAIWISPIFASPMADMGYDVSDYTDIDPLFGTLDDFDAMIARAHELGLKVILDQVISHSSKEHPFFKESQASRDNDKADWYVWADPSPDGTAPTNWLSHFGGPAWTYEPRRGQYYMHNFLSDQPDFNMHNRDVQDYLIGTMRFWLERGVDGFRLDTVNYYFHDAKLRNNPPRPKGSNALGDDTYEMQEHRFDKTQPENIAFLKRLRALTDEFEGRTMVGEVGESQRSMQVMAEYTKGSDRLQMAYSFDMLGPTFTAVHFRKTMEAFFVAAPDGWPKWSFSNHDVERHATRWAEHGGDIDAVAKLAIAMLASFEGTLGIYQGEELGLEQTEMEYHELTDPPGLQFWPEVKGRDGCRTPMVWEAQAEFGGFSDAKPWLPVKEPQLARAVSTQDGAEGSVLEHYRAVLGYRRGSAVLRSGTTEFLDLDEPVLGLRRVAETQALTCVFNLSKESVELDVAGDAALALSGAAELTDGRLSLSGSGFAYLENAAGELPDLTVV